MTGASPSCHIRDRPLWRCDSLLLAGGCWDVLISTPLLSFHPTPHRAGCNGASCRRVMDFLISFFFSRSKLALFFLELVLGVFPRVDVAQ